MPNITMRVLQLTQTELRTLAGLPAPGQGGNTDNKVIAFRFAFRHASFSPLELTLAAHGRKNTNTNYEADWLLLGELPGNVTEEISLMEPTIFGNLRLGVKSFLQAMDYHQGSGTFRIDFDMIEFWPAVFNMAGAGYTGQVYYRLKAVKDGKVVKDLDPDTLRPDSMLHPSPPAEPTSDAP